MIRTQVYLTDDLVQDIRFVAMRRQKPEAAVIRELLRKSLVTERPKKNAGEALLEMAKHAVPGPKDLASNLFKYLYGEKSNYATRKRQSIIK